MNTPVCQLLDDVPDPWFCTLDGREWITTGDGRGVVDRRYCHYRLAHVATPRAYRIVAEIRRAPQEGFLPFGDTIARIVGSISLRIVENQQP